MANTRTVGATGADHTTIGSAISWFQTNHDFGTDGIGTIQIIDSAEYNENITISGISGTPSSTAYLKLTVSSGNRHSGAAGTGHARIRGSTNGQHVITVSTDFTVIEYLEVQQDSTGSSDEGIRITSGTNDVIVSRCIVWTDQNVSDQDGIYAGNWAMSANIDNCILYGFNRGGIHGQNFGGNVTQTWNIDYCTVYDCGADDTSGDGGIIARADLAGDTANFNVYNTASLDSNGVNAADWVQTGGGTFNWAGSHNADTDGSLTGKITTSAQQNLTTSATTQSSGSFFVVNNLTAGSEDLTLLDDAAGNLAYGNGTDRSASEPDSRQDFSTDIAGNTRSTTSPSPDIGASEYTAGGTTVNCSTEALTLTENAATITVDVNVNANAEALTLTENAATVSLGVNVQANAEALTITENQATIGYDVNVNASAESLTITEYAATIDTGGDTTISASAESLVLTENAATITYDKNVNVNAASLTITENAASISTGATTLTQQDIDNIVDGVFNRIMENGETFAMQMLLIRAEAAGKLLVSGNTVTIRDAADTKDRITATVDSNGQRTAITTDVS